MTELRKEGLKHQFISSTAQDEPKITIQLRIKETEKKKNNDNSIRLLLWWQPTQGLVQEVRRLILSDGGGDVLVDGGPVVCVAVLPKM